MSELPPGWCLAAVREIGDVRLGRQRSPDRATGPHMRPYMRAANVTWNGISLHDVKEMDFSPEEFEVFALRDGDVLVGEASGSKLEVGKSAIWSGEVPGACFQNTLIRVRCAGAVLPEYLQKHLAHDARRGALAEISKGIGIHHLGAAGLAEWKIGLAPLPEQKRIADKLDTLLARLNACRDRLDRVATILKRFRQSVLAAATSGELTREWRKARGLEAEWRHASLGSLLVDVRYGTAKKCAYEPRKTPVLRIPNVVDGSISRADLKYADFDETERAKLALAAGDLLMIRSNGSLGLVGRTALVSEHEAGFLYAGYLIRLRADTLQAHPAYLSLFLASPASRARIELTARSTTGVNNINTEEIRAFPIEIPPLDEQDEVVRRVGELFELAARLEQRLELAQGQVARTTPSTLAKAFRGGLVPQDPDDEPASELLAKLKDQRSAAAAEPPHKRPKELGKRPTIMSNTDKEAIKAAILKLKADSFSFDDLRTQVAADYESLKDALFELLEEPQPVVRQVFDKKAKTMQLVRVRP